MILLPTGQVLYVAGTGVASIYTPDGHHFEHLEPVITSVSTTLRPGHHVTVHGHRFNGMSQAVSYGDDCTAATNYPLARLRYHDGTVLYCRTHRHSTMAVATGNAHVRTRLEVPVTAPPGEALLEIVANGVPSDPVCVEVEGQWWSDVIKDLEAQAWLVLIGSRADGPLIVIGPDGRPYPVPPWGPEDLVREAGHAAEKVRSGLNDLAQVFDRFDKTVVSAAAERADTPRDIEPSSAREVVGRV
jgi:hypothetical protein